jgi:serine beta-lactamase-like protein LACTB
VNHNTLYRWCWWLCLVTIAPLAVAENPARWIDTQKIDNAIKQEIEKQSLVGVSIGVIQNNSIVYLQGYGLANRQTQTPMTSKSLVNWASCSKPVAAVRVMQLVQDGKLKLDAPIVDYLPRLPEHLQKITTRQLLCHQSGVPHYANGFIFPGKYPDASDDRLDPLYSLSRFLNARLIFESGTRMEYSSYAYVLLSAVIQSAGGLPMHKQIEAEIIQPLELSSFQLDLEYTDQPNWSVALSSCWG